MTFTRRPSCLFRQPAHHNQINPRRRATTCTAYEQLQAGRRRSPPDRDAVTDNRCSLRHTRLGAWVGVSMIVWPWASCRGSRVMFHALDAYVTEYIHVCIHLRSETTAQRRWVQWLGHMHFTHVHVSTLVITCTIELETHTQTTRSRFHNYLKIKHSSLFPIAI
jgi:hypothetical protein